MDDTTAIILTWILFALIVVVFFWCVKALFWICHPSWWSKELRNLAEQRRTGTLPGQQYMQRDEGVSLKERFPELNSPEFNNVPGNIYYFGE